MGVETTAAIVFLVLVVVILIIKRKKLIIQKIFFPLLYVILWKTKKGLKLIDRIGKWKWVKWFGYSAIIVGFLAMGFMAGLLVYNFVKMLLNMAGPSVALVLPFKVKGAFYVPFFYWIISIFILAIAHEGAHGIVARANKIKVKSIGIGFLSALVPIVPLAFVEPDEKSMAKKKKGQQLAMLGAGSFANLVIAFVMLGILFFVAGPAADNIQSYEGVVISDLTKEGIAEQAGLKEGEIVKEVEGIKVSYVRNFTDALKDKRPGEGIFIKTDKGDYNITLGENPENKSKGYLGVSIGQSTKIKKEIIAQYGVFLPNAFIWFVGLLVWIYLLNLGIGLFNLLPLGPLDGGRMYLIALQRFMKKERAYWIWKNTGRVILFIILANLFVSWLV